MRAVDADELIEHAYRDRLDSRERIADMIRNAPTVEEREIGHWIYDSESYPMGDSHGHYECDICGYWLRGTESNYCPDCGAKMEGVKE